MYTYNVPDMSCQHCVSTITEAVKSVDPSADVKANLAAGSVAVQSQVEAARIEEAMRKAGYPAEAAAD